MPIVVDYSPVSLAGDLAVRAGLGRQFMDRFAMERQLVEQELQRRQIDNAQFNADRAFLLQNALLNRPAPTSSAYEPRVIGPAQSAPAPPPAPNRDEIRAQQIKEQLGNMLKRGTITPQQADLFTLGTMAGNESLAALGFRPEPQTQAPKDATQQMLRDAANLRIKVIDTQLKALASEREQYPERYDQITDQIMGLERQKATVYEGLLRANAQTPTLDALTQPPGAAAQQPPPYQPPKSARPTEAEVRILLEQVAQFVNNDPKLKNLPEEQKQKAIRSIAIGELKRRGYTDLTTKDK